MKLNRIQRRSMWKKSQSISKNNNSSKDMNNVHNIPQTVWTTTTTTANMINWMPKQHGTRIQARRNNNIINYIIYAKHLYKKKQMHIQQFDIPHHSSMTIQCSKVKTFQLSEPQLITVSRFRGWSCCWNLAGLGHANLSCCRKRGSSIPKTFSVRG